MKLAMLHFVKKILTSTLLILAMMPSVSVASEISVRPFLIDETLVPRDIIERKITIKSEYAQRKAELYATVNEITLDETGEIKEFISPSMTDRTNTVSSWVEITRGRIEVLPNETVEIPLTIRTHPFAVPGEYQVFIGLVEAANRPKAESIAMAGDANGVIVKITIADERENSMRISGFVVNRFITGDDKRDINIEVENIGDLASSPTGEIIFYDSRGIEVTSIPVNEGGAVVAPGEKVTLKSKVPLEGDLGRFKANVSLKYGDNQAALLHDTAFFYMMPIQLLLALFGGILVSAILGALLLRRVFSKHEDDEEKIDEVRMYVRDGHDAIPKDHDINLKKTE